MTRWEKAQRHEERMNTLARFEGLWVFLAYLFGLPLAMWLLFVVLPWLWRT